MLAQAVRASVHQPQTGEAQSIMLVEVCEVAAAMQLISQPSAACRNASSVSGARWQSWHHREPWTWLCISARSVTDTLGRCCVA